MTKYALVLEYDGSEFYGWQIQKNLPTIQGYLEHALSKFANHYISTITAGRTDTGVHALNQVVHFSSDVTRQLNGWVYGVNAFLPKTIRIKSVSIVDDEFDARFSALSRTYHYYLLNRSYSSAHIEQQIGWYHMPLDIGLISEAATFLCGRHDFSSFRAAGCQANSPIREMYNVAVERRNDVIRFSFTANAFLHHMVRNLVGALIYVGNGKLSVSEFVDIFHAADRTKAPPTFMPNGLYLVDVDYHKQVVTNFCDDIWLYNL